VEDGGRGGSPGPGGGAVRARGRFRRGGEEELGVGFGAPARRQPLGNPRRRAGGPPEQAARREGRRRRLGARRRRRRRTGSGEGFRSL